jgi:hypothetical protein
MRGTRAGPRSQGPPSICKIQLGAGADQQLLLALAKRPDDDILRASMDIARRTHRDTASLVAHLVVIDDRHLFLREGYPSLFVSCRDALRMSEGQRTT